MSSREPTTGGAKTVLSQPAQLGMRGVWHHRWCVGKCTRPLTNFGVTKQPYREIQPLQQNENKVQIIIKAFLQVPSGIVLVISNLGHVL